MKIFISQYFQCTIFPATRFKRTSNHWCINQRFYTAELTHEYFAQCRYHSSHFVHALQINEYRWSSLSPADLTTFNFKPQNLPVTWRWQVRKDTYIIVIPCSPLFYLILPRYVYNVFFESCEQTKIFSYSLLLLLICFEYLYSNPILVATFKS